MASAVAKRSNHRATRSASWSVMHSDEELARILQMQEEKEYQDHQAAKEVQCQSDHQLARLLSKYDNHLDAGTNLDEFHNSRHPTRPPTTGRNASNSTIPAPRSRSQNTTAISVTDSDTDFSDCFEDTAFDDELSTALERDRNAAESLAERQDAADALVRDDEIAAALQNDEQLNRMGESALEVSGSMMGEPGNASFNPIVVSPLSGVSVRSRSVLSNLGNEPMESSAVSIDVSNDGDWTSENELAFSPETASASTNNSLLMSVNMAWNAVGSAVNWVSELFSGAQPPLQSSAGTRVTTHPGGDAEEEDEEDEEEGCEEEEEDDDDGWGEEEDSDDFGDLDDADDIDDDEVAAFGMMDSDMDDSDDDNVEGMMVFTEEDVVSRGRGLVQAEIDVLPTRTYQSRPPQAATATSGAAADAAGASEHQRQNECQVCLSSFADGEVLRTLPCCHLFHSECIDVWLQRNAICPVCRVRIRDEIGCR